MQPVQRFRYRVVGRVQRVYFRASAQAVARELGLTSWVRNEPDGSVLAEAEGPAPALRQFAHWLAQGPPQALVQQLQQTEVPPLADTEGDFLVIA